MRSSRSVSAAREAAAEAAAQLVEPGMTIGLGSGRAVWAVVERLPAGTRAVVASELTRERALTAGIEVLELDGSFELDLALDGADEVDGSLGLIKGGGGALLAGEDRDLGCAPFRGGGRGPEEGRPPGRALPAPGRGGAVRRGGTRAAGWAICCRTPNCAALRRGPSRFLTDEGHYILDAPIPAGTDPAALADALARVPGVVEHGLFLDMAELALLGHPDGTVERLERP